MPQAAPASLRSSWWAERVSGLHAFRAALHPGPFALTADAFKAIWLDDVDETVPLLSFVRGFPVVGAWICTFPLVRCWRRSGLRATARRAVISVLLAVRLPSVRRRYIRRHEDLRLRDVVGDAVVARSRLG